MSAFVDFLLKYFNQIIQFVTETLFLFLQPRKFFSIISNEKTQESIKRLVTYIILFEVVAVSLLSLVDKKSNIDLITLIGSSVFDGTIILIYLPIFIVIGKISKPSVPSKVSIAYLIIIKMVLGVGLVVLTALFLLFESYTFAIIRGVYFFTFLMVLYLSYSFIFNYQLKSRIVSLVTTIVLVVSFSILLGFLMNLTPFEPTNFTSKMIITDPIGREIDDYIKNLQEYELYKGEYSIDYIIDSYNKLKDENEILQVYDELVINQNIYVDELKSKNDFLDSLRSTFFFNTTKMFLDLNKEETALGVNYIRSLARFFSDYKLKKSDEVFFKSFSHLQDQLIELLSIRSEYREKMNEIFKVRKELYKYGLLVL